MDIGKASESVKRLVAELRSLARRVSSATPVNRAGRSTTLIGLLFAVGLLGGLRIGESQIWLAPPLFTLVLAALMLGALDGHGAIALKRLLYSSRSAVDLHGLLVVLAIVFASAQAFHAVIPAGSPRWLVYLLFFLSLLALNTRIIAADHARMLWTLAAVFGAAFTVTFVILPSSPPGGVRAWFCRILPGCHPRHPATGYLAFGTLFLYLLALAGLARMTRDPSDGLPADSPSI
ncbi:MAG: hypothetical protein F4087_06330 [Gemmatimonadetes bacterium]|nr:hypothetical protein [Gemmatimonadota bacterium]MYE69569.1 hypothetical protein [Gemmatimonadota bacterium]MYJ68113.1 hypothetical protein [Gemmatimonadota bacterium]